MIWLIRHTERLLFEDEKWQKSKRRLENKYDMPITNNGKKYLEKAVKEMIKNDTNFDKIDYIYSSSMTRCVQTSFEIQKNIKKYTKKFIPIKIDYGLREIHPIEYYNHLKYVNGKIEYKPDFKKEIVLDKKLHLKYHLKKYGDRIDKNYKSQTKFNEAKYRDKDWISGCNFALNSMKKILKNDKNNNFIICSHAVAIMNSLTAFTNKITPFEIRKKIYGNENWATLTGFNINPKNKNPYKLIYGPTAKYWNSNL